MLDFFKGGRMDDVKGIRHAIVQFVKEQLQKLEGEGSNVLGLCLYIRSTDKDRHLYDGAVYADEKDRFKDEEIQKIADDFAIDLPPDWTLDIEFTDRLPAEAVRANGVDVALYISTRRKQKAAVDTTAFIKVLVGETERPLYELTPSMGKMTIGREKQVQTAEGFYRENKIAFTGTNNESNKSVSRQHAHIEWDAEKGGYYLFADEGGIPPYNKLKVGVDNATPFKLQTVEIGHRLQEGDQIILGESAALKFTLTGK